MTRSRGRSSKLFCNWIEPMPQLLRRTYNSLTRLGAKRSVESLFSIAEDSFFDMRMGTDTTSRIPQAKLRVIAPENQAQAKPYVMTRARALRRAFEHSGAPLDRRFIDIGSGKGKVVMTAALFGFKHIVGIEFAPELVELARRNLAKIEDHLPSSTDVQVVCADATKYDYGPDDCVFFLYNPFCANVMTGFCQQLARSLKAYPRKLWIIYTEPDYVDVMLRELPVHEKPRLVYGGFEIAFLTYDPATN